MAEDTSVRATLAVALIGADALLAARPATPVQVLHGCLDAGFAAAYPATWGDELVARACLASLAHESAARVALCSCPFASRRVEETQLAAERLTLAAPPVAAARLVRAAYGDHAIRITFIGGCPSAIDASIDAHVTPAAFLDTLSDRGIDLSALPEVFESVLPPDRRRFLSVPGGAPTSELLAEEGWRRVFCPQEVESGEALLIDLGAEAGCLCAGGEFGRAAVEDLEPPRSLSPVVDPLIAVDMRATPTFAPAPWRAPEPEIDETRDENQRELFDEPLPDDTAAPIAAQSDIVSEAIERAEHRSVEEGGVVAAEGAGETPELRAVVDAPLVGEVIDVTPGSFEPRARRWGPPAVVLPDALQRPSRRFSGLAIGLAIALAVTFPLAAIGGFVLWRSGAGSLRFRSAPSAPTTASGAWTDSAVHRAIDSATAVKVDSVASALASEPDTSVLEHRVDSVAGLAASPPAPKRTAERASNEVSAAKRSSQPRVPPRVQLESLQRGALESRPASRQVQSVGQSRAADATISVVTPTGDSTANEREALRRDIALRRARADSLARVVDSLNKLRARVPQKP